jgi:membrane-bound serine protease (ClpP class)
MVAAAARAINSRVARSDAKGMTRRLRAILAAAATAALLAVTTDNRADTLIKKDGKTFEGRVVAESADSVTFESNAGGITLRQKVSRANIRSIERQVVEGPGYCRIPFVGDVGRQIKADDLRAALNEARRGGAEYVILVIDSPGGEIREWAKLMIVLDENRDLKFVAYCKEALSAAAMTALACPHLVMAPEASIGAAVPYRVSPEGTPQDVDEKFRSAFRAATRAASGMGGRTDLWVRGMSEMDLELALVPGAAGRPKLIEGPAPENGRPIKHKGQILTLTAREALDAGLSDGTVRSLGEIREVLGLKAWHDTGDAAWSVIANRHRAAETRDNEHTERVKRQMAVRKDVQEVTERWNRALAQVDAIDAALVKLRERYAAESKQIDADFQRDFQATQGRGAAAIRVKEEARAKQFDLARRTEDERTKLLAARNAAMEETRKLLEQREKLIASAND